MIDCVVLSIVNKRTDHLRHTFFFCDSACESEFMKKNPKQTIADYESPLYTYSIPASHLTEICNNCQRSLDQEM